MNGTSPQPAGSADADIPPPPRGLKAAVIIMGILLVAGFVAVFLTIIYRATTGGDGDGNAASLRGVWGPVEVPVPPGAAIVSTTIAEDRALIRLREPDGGEALLVLDLRRGVELGRFRFSPE